MTDFAGAVALITGAAGGMGRAHAQLFAQKGARVIVQDINEIGLDETVELIKASGGLADKIVCDIANPRDVSEKFTAAIRRSGGIDVLVNNAGIGDHAPIEDVSEEFFDRMFGIHVKGTFFATKAAIPFMKERKKGKIVNISSMWSMMGWHYASTYIAAKSAILGLTKSWAKEFAPWNINVNAIAPGGVLTDQVLKQPNIEKTMAGKIALVPLGRYCDLIEISYSVVFLASSEADFITGQTLSPNGGQAIIGV